MSVYQYHRGETPPDARRVVCTVARYARDVGISPDEVCDRLRRGVLIWAYLPLKGGWDIVEGPYHPVYGGRIPKWLLPYANESDRRRHKGDVSESGREGYLNTEQWIQAMPPFWCWACGGSKRVLPMMLWMLFLPVALPLGCFYMLFIADKSRLRCLTTRQYLEAYREYGDNGVMGDMTLAHRDDVQWLLGTGRYASEYR